MIANWGRQHLFLPIAGIFDNLSIPAAVSINRLQYYKRLESSQTLTICFDWSENKSQPESFNFFSFTLNEDVLTAELLILESDDT